MRVITIILSLIVCFTNISWCMLEQTSMPHTQVVTKLQKPEVIQWILERIQPLNAGRLFKAKNTGARSNCTLLAEKCVKVLAGLEKPSLVPARKRNFDITFRTADNNAIVYHEVKRAEQAELVPHQEFTETIDLLDTIAKTNIDTTQAPKQDSLKYITSHRSTITEDIKNLAGSAESHGEDKTLAGLIYYYYKNYDAGHLANFFRDNVGNVFFIDAQNENITEIPPTKVLNYDLKDELFFYPLTPRNGYFIKTESANPLIKNEPVNQDNQTAHSTQSLSTLYSCICIFKGTINELKNHIKKEHVISIDNTKRYQCSLETCQTSYMRPRDLLRHIHSHTGDKPHACDHPGCSKAFPEPKALARHKRNNHNGDKTYVCDYPGCNKAYFDFSSLTLHHKSKHKGNKHVCNHPGCNKAFSQAGDLKRHKYSKHTDNKPYA